MATLDLHIDGGYYRTLHKGSLGDVVRKLMVVIVRPVDYNRVLTILEQNGEFVVKGRARLRKGRLVDFCPGAKPKPQPSPVYEGYTGWVNAELVIKP